jgi:hypothetical protein
LKIDVLPGDGRDLFGGFRALRIPGLAIQKGISLAAIQKILGHDRLGTTAICLNLTDTVDEYSQKW